MDLSKYKYLSIDGKRDGLVLLYVENGSVHPVLFTEEQADRLDQAIPEILDRIHIDNEIVLGNINE